MTLTTAVEDPSVHVIDLDEERRLQALEDLQVLDTPPEERFDRITQLARRLFGVQVALVTLLDRDRQWFKSTSGADLVEIPRSLSFCDTTIHTPSGLVVEDLSRDERFSSNALVTGPSGVRFYAGEALRAPGGEPVGTLCLLDDRPRAFSDADRQTLHDLASYVQHELAVREEYVRAAEVQRGLLPRAVPVLPGYEIAGTCTPARAVGGDFFDWHPVDGGVGLTVADVMGKGFAGAIMMASVRAVLRSGAGLASAAAAVTAAAAVLEADLDETGTFVTLFHGWLCPEDGRVRYTDAGHGLTLVLRADGTDERLAASGLPLGAWAGSTWESGEVVLHPGDVLLSFSDGLLDLFDGSLDSLDAIAGLARGCRSAQEVVQRITTLSRRDELGDDVTALAVFRKPDTDPSPGGTA